MMKGQWLSTVYPLTVIDGTMPRCDAYGPQGSLLRLRVVAQRCEYKSSREAVVLDDRSPGLLIDASVGLPGDAWQRYVDMAKVVEPPKRRPTLPSCPSCVVGRAWRWGWSPARKEPTMANITLAARELDRPVVTRSTVFRGPNGEVIIEVTVDGRTLLLTSDTADRMARSIESILVAG